MIHEHNKDNSSTYKLDINDFSFMSEEEKFGNFLGA